MLKSIFSLDDSSFKLDSIWVETLLKQLWQFKWRKKFNFYLLFGPTKKMIDSSRYVGRFLSKLQQLQSKVWSICSKELMLSS